MKSVTYKGPDRAVQIDGKRLVRNEPQEVPNDLADELLKGSDRLPGEHDFVEKKSGKKTDHKDAGEPERKGSGIAQSQPDATTRADQ